MLQVWLMSQQGPLLVWRAEQKRWQPYSDWQQVREDFGKQSVCLYFPSRHLQYLATELTLSQSKQLGEAGRQYLFEETSLTPVEQLKVREWQGAMGLQLYGVANNDLQAWSQSALLADYNIAAMLPDFLLLPIPEEGAGQQITLYQDQYTSLVRQSESLGMAVSYLPLLLERLAHLNEICVLTPLTAVDSLVHQQSITSPLAAGEEQPTVAPAVTDDTDYDSDTATGAEVDNGQAHSLDQDSFVQRLSQELSDRGLIVSQLAIQPLPVAVPERHPLNFYVKPSSTRLTPYLKTTMIVALVALGLQIAADALQYYHYQRATEATELATRAQYDAWFPNEPLSPTNTVEVALKPKLANTASTQSEHLSILSRVAPLLKQSSLVAQTLVIEPNTLSFTVVADNRDKLDKFASTLQAQGFNASLGSVSNPGENQVAGQVTISLSSPNPDGQS